MHRNRLLILKSLMKVLPLQQLRNGILRHQAYEVIGGERSHPAPVKINHSLLWIENLEHLRLISFRVGLNLLTRKRWPRHRPPRRVADHAREIADQKNCSVPEILKMF